jgi:hypothetical protein
MRTMRVQLPAVAAVLAVALALPAVSGAAPSPTAGAAAKAKAKAKKKKGRKGRKPAPKKAEPKTATINAEFSVRRDDPLGFGNDGGPSWQQIKVTVKDAKLTFRSDNPKSAGGQAKATFEYRAEAHTTDRSWAAGCDSEDRVTTGRWSGKTGVTVRPSSWLQTKGKSKKFLGYEVLVGLPDDFPLSTTGSYLAWETILMQNCQTNPIDAPLGSWGVGFTDPTPKGLLNSDGRSVSLGSIDTGEDDTGTASGSVAFSASMK